MLRRTLTYAEAAKAVTAILRDRPNPNIAAQLLREAADILQPVEPSRQ